MRRNPLRNRRGLRKLVPAIGGFVIFAGVVLLGIAVLASSGFFNVGWLLERKYVFIFAVLVILIGLFDTIASIIIARW